MAVEAAGSELPHWALQPVLGVTVVAPRSPNSRSVATIPEVLDDLVSWIDIDTLAWGQRYAVVTAWRMLYTLEDCPFASKLGALEWAPRTLARRWQPLLGQVATSAAPAGSQTDPRAESPLVPGLGRKVARTQGQCVRGRG